MSYDYVYVKIFLFMNLPESTQLCRHLGTVDCLQENETQHLLKYNCKKSCQIYIEGSAPKKDQLLG